MCFVHGASLNSLLIWALLYMFKNACSHLMMARFWDTLMWGFLKLKRGRLECVISDL